MTISPHQCRAARALLDWSQSTIAEVAGVARATIAEFETEKRMPIGNNLAAIREAFEHYGVTFIDGEAVGAVIRPPRIEAGVVQGQRPAVIFLEEGGEPVALSLEDAAIEAERAAQERELNRARAIRRALLDAEKLKK